MTRPTQRSPGAGVRRPLSRKPKELAAAPTLLQLARGPGGAVLVGPRTPATGGAVGAGSPAPGVTDEQSDVLLADGMRGARDPEADRLARQIARRLSVRRPRRRTGHDRRGAGTLASLAYCGGSDDIDLDRTIEVLAERPIPDDEDIIVRERVRTRRCVLLAVDVSGSMRGERVRTAAATVGALAGELRDDSLAVIAFWSNAVVLLPFGAPVRPAALLDDLLALPARGLTNIAFPLELARRLLAAPPHRDKRVVLLTDGVHNAGPDPRDAAAALPRVDVLLESVGEHDPELSREIAVAGHGTMCPIRNHRDVAPALTRLFRT
ncbi:vWA domain-containing protein [Pseudonocardia oceani]|uniref:vWA domain-containing protein n=1 Tax=Pseudonocardia oceani TaxID=2792013 RepID=UPI0027E371C6|nr:VWA domain-containing protein [Pseudonocardia oceani]